METNLRRTLLLSRGDPLVFLERPISAGILAVGVLILLVVLLQARPERSRETES